MDPVQHRRSAVPERQRSNNHITDCWGTGGNQIVHDRVEDKAAVRIMRGQGLKT